MITRIQKRIGIVTQAIIHIITLMGFIFVVNVVPSYAVYVMMHPHPDASTYSGGVLFMTVFITLIWFVDRVSKITHTYKQLLIETKKKNHSDVSE